VVPVVAVVSGCVSRVVVPVVASGVVSRVAVVAVTSVGMLSAVLGRTAVSSVDIA